MKRDKNISEAVGNIGKRSEAKLECFEEEIL